MWKQWYVYHVIVLFLNWHFPSSSDLVGIWEKVIDALITDSLILLEKADTIYTIITRVMDSGVKFIF